MLHLSSDVLIGPRAIISQGSKRKEQGIQRSMIALEPQGLHVQYRISYTEYFDYVLDMIKRCHSGGATIRNLSQSSQSCADCSHVRRFP